MHGRYVIALCLGFLISSLVSGYNYWKVREERENFRTAWIDQLYRNAESEQQLSQCMEKTRMDRRNSGVSL